MVGSSGRQRVPCDALSDFSIPKPPKIVLNIFSEICNSFFKKISHSSSEISTLACIRDALLPKLISGDQIMQILNLSPGPKVAQIIEEIKDLTRFSRVGFSLAIDCLDLERNKIGAQSQAIDQLW